MSPCLALPGCWPVGFVATGAVTELYPYGSKDTVGVGSLTRFLSCHGRVGIIHLTRSRLDESTRTPLRRNTHPPPTSTSLPQAARVNRNAALILEVGRRYRFCCARSLRSLPEAPRCAPIAPVLRTKIKDDCRLANLPFDDCEDLNSECDQDSQRWRKRSDQAPVPRGANCSLHPRRICGMPRRTLSRRV